jgi:hypothetical protein
LAAVVAIIIVYINVKNRKKAIKKYIPEARDTTVSSLLPLRGLRWPSWVFVVPLWPPSWWDLVVIGCVAWWSWLGLTWLRVVLVVVVVVVVV